MAALQVCRQYLRSWNQAAHDTGGDAPAGLRDEVNAARTACTLLEAERAHVSRAIVREPVSSGSHQPTSFDAVLADVGSTP